MKKENEIKNNKKLTEVTSLTLTYEEQVKIANSSDVYKILKTILKRENNLFKSSRLNTNFSKKHSISPANNKLKISEIYERDVFTAQEHFWVLGLDNEDMLLSINTVALGDIESVSANPMNTFSYLIMQAARYCIVAHNHIGGSVKPSEADIDTTCRLYNSGEILKIPVKDHIIISFDTYFSFLDMGLMDTIRTNTKYMPNYLMEERFIEEGKKIRSKALKEGMANGIEKGENQGRIKEKIDIAKNMKMFKIENEIIAKATGLTKKDIENL